MPLSNGPVTKKRKTGEGKNKNKYGSGRGHVGDSDALPEINDGYEPLSLRDIQVRILTLCQRVPKVPEKGIDPDDLEVVEQFATQLQTCIEEFNLLVVCVATATYQWGGDRTGASDQNLTILSGEIAASHEHIASTVTPRLTNVLTPVVSLVTDKTIVTKQARGDGSGNGSAASGEREVRENTYKREEEDPNFCKLTRQILSRNAPMLRQVVLASFHKIVRCIGDYLQAQSKDDQVDARSLY